MVEAALHTLAKSYVETTVRDSGASIPSIPSHESVLADGECGPDTPSPSGSFRAVGDLSVTFGEPTVEFPDDDPEELFTLVVLADVLLTNVRLTKLGCLRRRGRNRRVKRRVNRRIGGTKCTGTLKVTARVVRDAENQCARVEMGSELLDPKCHSRPRVPARILIAVRLVIERINAKIDAFESGDAESVGAKVDLSAWQTVVEDAIRSDLIEVC